MVLILWFPYIFFQVFVKHAQIFVLLVRSLITSCSTRMVFNKNGITMIFVLAFFHFFDSILIVNLLNPSLCKVFPLFWKAYRIRWPTVLNVNNRSCNRCFKINFFFYFETTMFSRDFPSFIFKINHVLIEKKDNSPKKLIYLRRNYIVLM